MSSEASALDSLNDDDDDSNFGKKCLFLGIPVLAALIYSATKLK